ncbi:MAG: hypothetical protein V5B33_13850 [Candidatus Accumulibacter sp. UW20]|jgi:hypothetical protein
MSRVLLETQTLPARSGLRFLDACSGQPIVEGLRCTLYRRRDGRLLASGVLTPAGVHHWPDLAAAWRSEFVSPPLPPSASDAEVLVDDRRNRYLPLRLLWAPEPAADSPPIVNLTLASAPQRQPPSGAAVVHALLADADGIPAAWARVVATDRQSRSTVGMSDDGGRLTLYLPFPRPERRSASSPPDSPPASPTIAATISLRVFHDPRVASEARAAALRGAPLIAPRLCGWSAQAEVRALAHLGASDLYGPLRLQPDRPSVPVTAGLPPNRSELRLAPL